MKGYVQLLNIFIPLRTLRYVIIATAIIILCCFPLSIFAQLSIPYTSIPKTIDGSLDDWDLDTSVCSTVKQDPPYSSNYFCINTCWDEHYLYIIYRVYDKHFITVSTGNNNYFVWRNDGVEFLIDPLNDSKNRVDINDYQFLFDINGYYGIHKGDKSKIENLKCKVPLAFGVATLAFEHAVKYYGTINNNTRTDSLYVIELALPWGGLGIIPKTNYIFKASFRCNDADSLVPMESKYDKYVELYHDQPTLNCRTIGSSSYYGNPKLWQKAKLVGSPGTIYLLAKKHPWWWIYISLPLVILLLVVIFVQFRRIRQLREIPQKEEYKNRQFVQIINKTNDYNQNEATPIKNTDLDKAPSNQKESNRNMELIEELKRHILKNIESNITTEDLAKKLGYTPRTVQRIFKEEINMVPRTFILLLKLEQAAKILKTERKTVSEVSYQFGFSDPSHFARAFKKYFNLSPTDYINQNQNDISN